MKTFLNVLLTLIRLPVTAVRLVKRLGDKIEECIEDFVESLPDLVSDFAEGFGGGKNLTPFRREEKLLRTFIRMDAMILGKRCHYTGRAMLNLADFYRRHKLHGQADSWYCKGLKIMEGDLEAGDPKLIEAYRRVADFMFSYFKFAEAEALLEKAIAARDDTECAEHAEDLHLLGIVRMKLDNPRGAVGPLVESLRIRERASRLLSLDCDGLMLEIAKVYDAIGNKAEAARLREKANLLSDYAVMHKALGEEHFSLHKTLSRLAEIYASEGDAEKRDYLRDWAELVLLANKVKGVEYFNLPRDLERLAELYEKRNHGGDRTVAFHARARAKRIRDKRCA